MANDDAHGRMASLPLVLPQDVIGRRELLVIAPHPDDESLGCGGLLAWAAMTGRRPRVLFVTDGEGSHTGSRLYPPRRLGRLRRAEAQRACAALGLTADALIFLGAPDAGVAALSAERRQSLIRTIQAWAASSCEVAVCIPAHTDPHGDHVAVHFLAKEALADCVNIRLFAYPVWTWVRRDTDGMALGRRVDIAAFLWTKGQAIAAHQSQHGGLITDADHAFTLPADLLQAAQLPYEVLFDVQL